MGNDAPWRGGRQKARASHMHYRSFDFAGTTRHCGVLLSRGGKGDESHLRRADLEMVQKGRVGGRQVDGEDVPTPSRGGLPHKAPRRWISVHEDRRPRSQQARTWPLGRRQEQVLHPHGLCTFSPLCHLTEEKEAAQA